MGHSGKVNRLEPSDNQYVDQNAKKQFQAVGWYPFLRTFFGENFGVSKAFVESFDGAQVKIGSCTFAITEDVIAKATQLLAIGESQFKGKSLFVDDVSNFLKPEHSNVDWSATIPISWFKLEWQGVINTLQHYITCEGRFSTVHMYLMRIVSHISGSKPMNLPFFLYKSLLKMSQKIQRNPNYLPYNLYHRGLIKILVVYHLRKTRCSWDKFLSTKGFLHVTSKKKMGRPKKQRAQAPTVVRAAGETLVSSPFQISLLSRLVGSFSSSSDRVTKSSYKRIEAEPNVPTPIAQQADRTYTRKQRILNESEAPGCLEQGSTSIISRRLSSKKDMKKSIEESTPVIGASIFQSNENLSPLVILLSMQMRVQKTE